MKKKKKDTRPVYVAYIPLPLITPIKTVVSSPIDPQKGYVWFRAGDTEKDNHDNPGGNPDQ